MKKIFLIVVLCCVSLPVFAENSLTLPAGRFRARVKPMYAFGIKTQYNNNGIENSLVNKYERSLDLTLAQSINPGLAALMQGSGMQTIGSFDPSLELSTLVFGNAVEYGLTENLTLGAILPVVSADSKFSLKFNKTSQAQNHPHPAISQTDFAKVAQDLAVSKGYAPLGNWDAIGLGDAELGVKYKFFSNNAWTLATKVGTRLPTGRTDDPDNLTDIGFGDGQTDLGATLLGDFTGLPNTLINISTKYTVQLPDKQTLRVPSEGELFTSKKENLSRDLGDRFDVAVYTEYSFLNLFNINATYAFFTKSQDSYKSALGYNATGLEKNTAQNKHSIDVGVGLSTMSLFRNGSFKLPMDAGLNVEVPLLGKNVAKATSVNLEYKLYF